MTKSVRLICAAAAIGVAACSGATVESWNHLNVDQGDWRGFKSPTLPSGWQVVDGALTRVGAGGDIITKEQYDNFELSLEWKISKGGNSGVFFHVVEDEAAKYVWETGPEMQVLDNKGHADGKNPSTSAASNFAMHAPLNDATRPVGEWNEARLVVDGPTVQHWLNGVKVVEYRLWSEDWNQRLQGSKFKSMPRYGKAPSGHIALQDHGDWVAFRNIKIRRIP
jgi:hypothetical protein